MDFDEARVVVQRQLDQLFAGERESPTVLPYGFDTNAAWAPLIEWDGVMGVYVYLVDKDTGGLTPLSFPEFVDMADPRRVGAWPDVWEADVSQALDIADDTAREAALAELAKHLPGKHDQSTHGPGKLGKGIGSLKGRQARLTELSGQTPIKGKTKVLGGGAMGDTKMVEVDPGVGGAKKYVDKRYDHQGPDGVHQTHGEIVQPAVMDAVGAHAAAVVQTGPTRIAMEVIPGRDAAASPRGAVDAAIRSPAGVRMAVGDYLLGQTDRHEGNWRITSDGKPVAIDGGFSFRASTYAQSAWALRRGPASLHLSDGRGGLRATIDIPRAEVAAMRPKLEALRPQFEALGRGDWHTVMMQRLDDIESRATP